MTTETPFASLMPLLEEAIAPFPKAAMFELAQQGYGSLYEQLVSCVISIRTLDEISLPASIRLFERARTPEQMLRLSKEEIADLINPAQYPGNKADTILHISAEAMSRFNGRLPADFDLLTSLKGVGPKCANLAIGVSANVPAISVDAHVHRVVNRWGVVQTGTPEKTLAQLQPWVERENWTSVNRLLMPFGKHICTHALPKCSTCPLLGPCSQVGVTRHR